MNTTKLIFAVPILLAMLRELDGYAIETSEEGNEKIGLHEIFDRKNCPMTIWSPCSVEGERCYEPPKTINKKTLTCFYVCTKIGASKYWDMNDVNDDGCEHWFEIDTGI